MYNQYSFTPFYQNPIPSGINNTASNLGGLGNMTGKKAFNWDGFLNSAQRTLNVINQAMPIYNQVKPMFRNIGTVFKVMGELNRPMNNTNNSNQSMTSNTNNNELPKTANINNPQFFL